MLFPEKNEITIENSSSLIVILISATITTAGLTVKCVVDRNENKKGIEVSDEEMSMVNIRMELYNFTQKTISLFCHTIAKTILKRYHYWMISETIIEEVIEKTHSLKGCLAILDFGEEKVSW